jgi:hypothetical protein
VLGLEARTPVQEIDRLKSALTNEAVDRRARTSEQTHQVTNPKQRFRQAVGVSW